MSDNPTQEKWPQFLVPLAFHSYGLPVNFQAMLLQPNKKNMKKLREVLYDLYKHLDSSAAIIDVSYMNKLVLFDERNDHTVVYLWHKYL